MKLPAIYCSALLLVALSLVDSYALGGPPAPASGFSGYAQPMVGMSASKSLSNVGEDNKRIDSLDQKAASETTFIPLVLWETVYTFANERTGVYAGTPERNIIEGTFLLEVGFRHALKNGTTLTAAWIPKIPGPGNEVWKDPFLTGSDRDETDRASQAFSFAVEGILATPFSVEYTFATQEIEDEQSGVSLVSAPESALTVHDLVLLKRSGDFHLFETRTRLPLSRSLMLGAGLFYLRGETEGEATSFHGGGGQLTFMFRTPRYEMFNSVSYSQAFYDEENPVFGEKMDTQSYNATMGIQYMKPWGWERAYLSLIAGVSKKDSDITFYDEESVMVGIGAGYAF